MSPSSKQHAGRVFAPPVTRIFLVRHGATDWTRQRRFQGHTDTPLNPEGKKQARRLRARFKRFDWDYLYASPLLRARRTAEILAYGRAGEIRYDKRLREIFFGRWEGKSAEELRAQPDPAFQKWCKGRRTSPPGGETLKDFNRRISGFFSEILKCHPGKTLLVVSHGGPIKAFIFQLLKIPAASLWSLRIEPGSVSLVSAGPDFSELAFLNDTSHLGQGFRI